MLMTVAAFIISAGYVQTLFKVAFLAVIYTILETLWTSFVTLSTHQIVVIITLLAHLQSAIHCGVAYFAVFFETLLTKLVCSL